MLRIGFQLFGNTKKELSQRHVLEPVCEACELVGQNKHAVAPNWLLYVLIKQLSHLLCEEATAYAPVSKFSRVK
jgi:hypothetical protein